MILSAARVKLNSEHRIDDSLPVRKNNPKHNGCTLVIVAHHLEYELKSTFRVLCSDGSSSLAAVLQPEHFPTTSAKSSQLLTYHVLSTLL